MSSLAIKPGLIALITLKPSLILSCRMAANSLSAAAVKDTPLVGKELSNHTGQRTMGFLCTDKAWSWPYTCRFSQRFPITLYQCVKENLFVFCLSQVSSSTPTRLYYVATAASRQLQDAIQVKFSNLVLWSAGQRISFGKLTGGHLHLILTFPEELSASIRAQHNKINTVLLLLSLSNNKSGSVWDEVDSEKVCQIILDINWLTEVLKLKII